MGRTTNACEEFHSHFNSQFYTAHPNIVFLTVLKEVQVDTDMLIKAATRKQKVPRKRLTRKIDFIEQKIAQYRNAEISMLSFVQAVSHRNWPATHISVTKT